MVDGSTHDSDEEGEEGEIGEDDEDEGSAEPQNSPSKASRQISTPPPSNQPDTEMAGTEALTSIPSLLNVEPKLELKTGSPLKNVLTPSALTSPLETHNPSQAPKAFPEIPQQSKTPSTSPPGKLDSAMQQQAAETAPPTLPSPPPGATIAEEIAAVEVRKEEEEEEDMLLDIIDEADNSNVGAGHVAAPEEPVLEMPTPAAVEERQATPQDHVQPDQDDDDDFPDLLGGLEKQLDGAGS